MTPGGALLIGLLAFLLDGTEMLALFCAVTAHELGHVLALRLLSCRVDAVSLTATGPVLHCASPQLGWRGMLCALSGPAGGALLWLGLRGLFPLAVEMSFVLTAVNLLPVLPLDGGRALYAVVMPFPHGARIVRCVRVVAAAGLFAVGVLCAVRGWGLAPLLFAVWLLLVPGDSCKTARDVVKYID